MTKLTKPSRELIMELLDEHAEWLNANKAEVRRPKYLKKKIITAKREVKAHV